jgi:hypothetical protein
VTVGDAGDHEDEDKDGENKDGRTLTEKGEKRGDKGNTAEEEGVLTPMLLADAHMLMPMPLADEDGAGAHAAC